MMQWRFAPSASPAVRAAFPEFDPILVQLLSGRGLTTQAAVDEFLHPDFGQDLGDPFLFRHMRTAVDRITRALTGRERITVYGDYDADGICGAALLAETLRALGGVVDVYLPDRVTEGYGLNMPAVTKIAQEGAKLLITVDCGISNRAEIARAKALGTDVLVVDHHHEPKALPDAALALINPVLSGEQYPFRGFCGAGTAFKVAQALLRATEYGKKLPNVPPLPVGWEKWLLDLVAIATVADFSDLLGENRTLVSYGLLVLRKTRRLGLRALYEVSGISPAAVSTSTIAFQIAPRLNAAGRLNHASSALFLLLTRDAQKAKTLAAELQRTNQERQRLTDAIAKEATAQIGPAPNDALVAAVGDRWPAGVIGIVAGKVLRKLHRPAIIMGREGEKIVGSGRSIDQYNLIEAVERAAQYLDRFGGHPQACGFTIVGEANLAAFVREMQRDANERLTSEDLLPTLTVDLELTLAQISWKLLDVQGMLEPFGEKNPRPVFACRDVRVVDRSPVGANGNHLRLTVEDGSGTRALFIGFGYGGSEGELATIGARLDIAFELDVNEWNGNRELQRKILDLRAHAGT